MTSATRALVFGLLLLAVTAPLPSAGFFPSLTLLSGGGQPSPQSENTEPPTGG